ncbi:MAG: hypothetical protein Q8876_09315, partial [Bacillota bacterium]|nr:hypothetical protein [Bacillota bacterium]
SVLNQKATDITAAGDNPYFAANTTDTGTNSSNSCTTTFTEQNGYLTSSIGLNDSYIYFDKDGSHAFGSQTAALNYASNHQDKMMTYDEEISRGIAKLLGVDGSNVNAGLAYDQIASRLDAYINGSSNDPLQLTDDQYSQVEKTVGISKSTFQKVFNRSTASDATRPLVAYKKAVGNAVLKQALNAKIFSSLGININSSLFNADDFFEIMHGNFQSLITVAASVMDDNLNLPTGSIETIISASSGNARDCALAEIGASLLGNYVGTGYVSLHGNIYQNFGRASIEQTLGIPRNTFVGQDLDQLISSVGEINFVKAFNIPVSNVNIDNDLTVFFDAAYAKSLQGFSTTYKLTKIQNSLIANSGWLLQSDKKSAYDDIQSKLKTQIKYAATSAAPGGAWTQSSINLKQGEDKNEINKFITRLNTLDNIFGLTKNTTVNMLAEAEISDSEDYACSTSGIVQTSECSGNNSPGWCKCDPNGGEVTKTWEKTKITPDDYVNKASQTATSNFLLLKALNIFGDNATQNQAIVNVVDTLRGFATNKDTINNNSFAALFDNLEKIFSYNLDNKVNLDNGTISAIIKNPGQTLSVLLPQATRQLDENMNLTGKTWSFSNVYRTYLSQYVNSNGIQTTQPYTYNGIALSTGSPILTSSTTDANGNTIVSPEQYASASAAATQDECSDYSPTKEQIDSWNSREKAVHDWLDQHPDYKVLYQEKNSTSSMVVTQANSISSSKEYQNHIDQLNAIAEEKYNVDQSYNACKVGHRGATTSSNVSASTKNTNRSSLHFDWNTMKATAISLVSQSIHDEIYTATKDTINMPPSDIAQLFTNGDMRYFYAAGIAYTANIVIDAVSGDKVATPAAFRYSYDDIKLATIGNSDAEQNAADMATYNYLNVENFAENGTYDDSLSPNNFADVCGGEGGVLAGGVNCILSQGFTPDSTVTLARNSDNLVNYQMQTDAKSYGVDPTKMTEARAQAQTQFKSLENQANACAIAQANSAHGIPVDSDTANTIKGLDCNSVYDDYSGVVAYRDSAISNTQKAFQTQMEFRMMDSALYSKDKNVYPGFA